MKKHMATFRKQLSPEDVSTTAMDIIQDVLTLETAIPLGRTLGVRGANGTDMALALCRIRRQAGNLLNPIKQQAAGEPMDGLAEFVDRLERGERVPVSDVHLTLAGLEMAAAKIRKHLETARAEA